MIDFNIDELEKLCKYEIGRGTANPYTINENPIHAMLEIITRLRQAEKDAARYRWLRNCDTKQTERLVESGHIVGFGVLDAIIDEAMQCK